MERVLRFDGPAARGLWIAADAAMIIKSALRSYSPAGQVILRKRFPFAAPPNCAGEDGAAGPKGGIAAVRLKLTLTTANSQQRPTSSPAY